MQPLALALHGRLKLGERVRAVLGAFDRLTMVVDDLARDLEGPRAGGSSVGDAGHLSWTNLAHACPWMRKVVLIA